MSGRLKLYSRIRGSDSSGTKFSRSLRVIDARRNGIDREVLRGGAWLVASWRSEALCLFKTIPRKRKYNAMRFLVCLRPAAKSTNNAERFSSICGEFCRKCVTGDGLMQGRIRSGESQLREG